MWVPPTKSASVLANAGAIAGFLGHRTGDRLCTLPTGIDVPLEPGVVRWSMLSESALDRARRRGRRLGIALYSVIMSAFILVCGTQVMYQGFWSPKADTSPDCKSGISSLISALRRARAAAAEEPLGERASLARFRQALLPEWQARGNLSKACGDDVWARHALSAIDRLRYAEEHAVRYESVDLAPSRRQVLVVEQTIASHPPSSR